jgi:hypothetical protein
LGKIMSATLVNEVEELSPPPDNLPTNKLIHGPLLPQLIRLALPTAAVQGRPRRVSDHDDAAWRGDAPPVKNSFLKPRVLLTFRAASRWHDRH